MNLIKKEQVSKVQLPGRVLQRVIEKGGFIESEKMTMGFARFSQESGTMQPHQHAEEIIYITSTKNAWARYGVAENELGERIALEDGETLRFNEREWHVFEWDEGGYLEIIYFFGQVDNLRPEKI